MNALTQSIAIRGVDLSDRLVMPPMASGKPNPDGTVSDSAAALLSFCCFCRLFSSSLSPFLSIISRFFLSINSGRGAQTQQKEQQAASLEKKIEKIQRQQVAVQEVEQIEPHAVPFSSKVMLDRSEYENLAAAAKKFYVQERKESKLQKALDAALKMISELKAKVAALTAELAEYKSVRGQLHAADLEQENSELRSKLHTYEDVISRNNLWSYFSRHRKIEIDREGLR